MNCFIAGMVGIGMTGAAFATLSVSQEEHNKLRDLLSPEIAKKYDEIASERRDHYIHGLTLGAAMSYLSVEAMRVSNIFYRVAIFFSVTLVVSLLYYMIMPKSDYMLRHLKTPEQEEAWLDIYLTMKHRYVAGFILGALASIPTSLAFC